MAVSIVIPTKNEEQNILKLIQSLAYQDFPWAGSEVILSDAKSDDETRSIFKESCKRAKLPHKVVDGGLPAVGRNNGAKAAKNDIIIFIDADITLPEKDTLYEVNKAFQNSKTELVTINLRISQDKIGDLLYRVFNLIQRLSKLTKPIGTTMFMAIRKQSFEREGGFDEELMHLEDIFLTKKFKSNSYKIIPRKLDADNRRFEKMGYWGYIKYFINNIPHLNDREYFKKDIGYWS